MSTLDAAPNEAVLLTGQESLDPPRIQLAAGPVTLELDPVLGLVRYIRLGDRELLRGIYAAIRDSAWNTIPPKVSNLKVDRQARSFRVTFDVDCVAGGVDYSWQGDIQGSADGTVRFGFDGTARNGFQRNRIGFCVLHPLRECAGQPVTIRTADGKTQQGRFPDLISPHQPFINIQAITHEVRPGQQAEVSFTGDVFEMEDHRNWTDGNYKTYCTPLAQPWPVNVKQGDRVQQSVTLRLIGTVPAARATTDRLTFNITADRGRIPQVGFGLDPRQAKLTGTEVQRLRALKPDHLRVDLKLDQPDWQSALARARADAQALGARLECAVFLTDAGQLQALAGEARELAVARWLVFAAGEKSTREPWLVQARKQLPAGAVIASGTNEYFTELNRERPPVAVSDAVCYSINPQVHAFDNASLIENLAAQRETVRTARSFVGDKWLAVTPVTLKPRFNPQAKVQPPDEPGKLPARFDRRQPSLFGAVWTLGSLKYLGEAGANSATYYETVGLGGLMERAGAVFPLYHVLADALEFRNGRVTRTLSSDPLRFEALLLESLQQRRLMLANTTAEPQTIALPDGLGTARRSRLLAASSYEEAAMRPEQWRQRWQAAPKTVTLPAYGVLTLEF